MAQTGYTPISIYYSSTSTNVPTAGNLVAGELAINTADGKLFYKDSSGVVQTIASKNGVAGGSNTQVQYNSSGSLAGSANMTFSGTALTLANDASISGLTVGKGGGNAANTTVLGSGAVAATNTGDYLTAVGYASLASNTSGAGSTAFGYYALNANTTGRNTAFGTQALKVNTTGSSNTAVGDYALGANTTASNNTAVGYQSAYSNATGTNLTALGYQSLYSNTVNDNLAVGNQALYSNTSGTKNVAVGMGVSGVGYSAMFSNTTGSENTALGCQALVYNTTGSYNTAIGRLALISNTTASRNTAVGYQTLYTNTTGTYNVAVGYQAGYNATGNGGTFIGDTAGYSVTSGTWNTLIGQNAGYYLTTGGKNSILGNYNGNQGGLDIRTASNYIVLSDGDGNPRAYWTGSGQYNQNSNTGGDTASNISNTSASTPYGIALGFTAAAPNNTSQYFLKCYDTGNNRLFIYSNGTVSNATGTYNTISDAKLKENIVDSTPKLDKLMNVKVRNYNLIGDELKQIGFVAQELEQVFPTLIDNVPDLDENNKPTGEITKGVKLTVMIPILVKAIQELKAEFDAYKATHP